MTILKIHNLNRFTFVFYVLLILLYSHCTEKQISNNPAGNYVFDKVLVNSIDETNSVLDGYYFNLKIPVSIDSNYVKCSFYSKDSLILKFWGQIIIAEENNLWDFKLSAAPVFNPISVRWNPFYSEGINEWPVIKSNKNQVWFKATNGQNDVIEVHIRRVMPNY